MRDCLKNKRDSTGGNTATCAHTSTHVHLHMYIYILHTHTQRETCNVFIFLKVFQRKKKKQRLERGSEVLVRWGGKKRLGRDFEVDTQEQSSVGRAGG